MEHKVGQRRGFQFLFAVITHIEFHARHWFPACDVLMLPVYDDPLSSFHWQPGVLCSPHSGTLQDSLMYLGGCLMESLSSNSRAVASNSTKQ